MLFYVFVRYSLLCDIGLVCVHTHPNIPARPASVTAAYPLLCGSGLSASVTAAYPLRWRLIRFGGSGLSASIRFGDSGLSGAAQEGYSCGLPLPESHVE